MKQNMKLRCVDQLEKNLKNMFRHYSVLIQQYYGNTPKNMFMLWLECVDSVV